VTKVFNYRKLIRGMGDAMIYLTKDLSNSTVASFQVSIDRINKFFYSHLVSFEHLQTFYEPDGSEVSIFKRKRLN
jgi:hypothetical protein